MKSIKSQLLILIFAAVLPALGIIIYSNYERQRRDINMAKDEAMIMVQGLANDHENVIEVTRRFLMTLAKLPALQNQNIAACTELFKELLKENTQYATIYAADSEGMIFANALSSGNITIKQRKYFQDAVQTKAFSAGEYTIGQVSRRAVLPFAFPVIDSSGRVTGVVAISLDLEKYGKNFGAITQFPKVATLNLLDRNYIFLYRYPDNENYAGKVDFPEIVKQISAGPQEGIFTIAGVDGGKRLFAYKRFYLSDSSSPYLYMRVDIPEEQALALTKTTFLRNIGLLIGSLMAALLIAWLLGHVLIVKRLNSLVDALRQVGQGDLSVRTGIEHKGDELGLLARSFDEMAEALETKELDRKQAKEALLDSEVKFKSFAEQALVGTYFLQDGVFKYVNPKFAQMFGYTVDECMNDMPFENLVYAEDLAKVKEQVRRRISGEIEFVHYTFRGVQKNGQIFDVEIYGSSSVHNGRIAAAGTILDITDRKQAEDALAASKADLDLALRSSRMGVWILDIETNKRTFNAQMYILLGIDPATFGGTAEEFYAAVHPDDREKIKEALARTIERDESYEPEYRTIWPDGSIHYVCARARLIRNEGGQPKGINGIVWDITKGKEAEEALRESEERFKQLAEVFPETIFEADIEGHVTYANKHGLEQFGYTEEDLRNGVNIFNLVVPDDHDKVRMRIKEKIQGIDRGYLDYQGMRKDGSTFYAMGLSVPMKVNGTTVGVRGFILDITERKKAEEKIKHLATHDALTNLPSLKLAKDRLGMALSQARRDKTTVAVMFIDLDGFKSVNDNLGHDAGDYVLKQVAQRLLSCVRETDTVARVGGDEFLLIATGIHAPENASQIAEKVIHLVSQPIIYKREQAVVGTSIGIALYPDNGEDMDQLIRQADEAMYRIKKAGKNGFCFI
jgi:diguanylate cyclase (GGDEF)-like protein/PAS domain S-box-containing protein